MMNRQHVSLPELNLVSPDIIQYRMASVCKLHEGRITMTENRGGKWIANILLVLFSLLVTLLIIEVATRSWLVNFADDALFKTYASTRQLQSRFGTDFDIVKTDFAPHRYLGFYPAPNVVNGDNRHNALGFRGDEIEIPKPDGTYRILTLGGSTTYGTSVLDYHNAYPYQLQQYLREQGYENVEVINGGASDYTSYESLINLQFRGLELEPDLVLIYHGFNDAHARLVYPPEAYRSDNSGALIPSLQNTRMPAVWEYSTALRIMGIAFGWTNSHNAIEFRLVSRPGTSYAAEFLKQQRQGAYPYGIFDQATAMDMFEANPPIYFRRNSINIASLAHQNSADVMFVTFAWSPDFPDEPTVNSEEYNFVLNEHNDITREVAEETGSYLFDFAEVMPTDTQYFDDGRHYTAEGNALRGQLIGDAIIDAGLLE